MNKKNRMALNTNCFLISNIKCYVNLRVSFARYDYLHLLEVSYSMVYELTSLLSTGFLLWEQYGNDLGYTGMNQNDTELHLSDTRII